MSEFTRNQNTMNGMFITEKVLTDDGSTYDTFINGVTDALIKHLIYYLKGKTASVVFKQSNTSSGTSITFTPNYPENNAMQNLPMVAIYSEQPFSERLTYGGIAKSFKGNKIRGRNARFDVWFDVWARTTQETNALAGLVKLLLDDAIEDTDFVYGRGIDDIVFKGSSNREFDISDNYVNDVSHIDTSINMRRQQMLYQVLFNYRIGLSTIPLTVDDPILSGIGSYSGDLDTNTVIQSLGFNVDFE